jgi:hypothetical protein
MKRSTPLAVVVACCALVAVAAGAQAQRLLAAKPGGYAIVSTGFVSAPNGVVSTGLGGCPTGKVPLGGGALITSNRLAANISSSIPEGTQWFVAVNNHTGSPTTFQIWAVCAKAPRRYQVVTSAAIADPSRTQASGFVSCPANTVVLGGGADPSAGEVHINTNSSYPDGNGWRARIDNNTDFDITIRVYALCGKQPTGYQHVTDTVTNPAGSQTHDDVICGPGTVPLSGGAESSSHSLLVNMNTSIPTNSDAWTVAENNASKSSATVTVHALCSS